MARPFYIVDVFAETRYAGNQLAVVRSAAGLMGSEMLQITREMNYSETTFILSEREQAGGFEVRIFSPEEELPFAGHPTLGTAYIIQQEMIKEKVSTVALNLKVGRIPVTFSYRDGSPDVLWMKQVPPSFGRTYGTAEIARVLNLGREAVDDRFPVQEVSTGLPFIIVPLKTLQAVQESRIDRERYLALIEQGEAKSIFIFCPETYHPDNQVNARMFDDYHGIPEDPATGSAGGCLAGYLVKHRYFGNAPVNLRVEQGYEIGRPSLLLLQAKEDGGEIAVNVGGKVIPVARGELL